MDVVALAHRDTLYRLDGRLDYVYFPVSGVMSSVLVMTDGRTMEVGATGREGMVGLTAVLGADRSPEEVFCQVPGTCRRMPAAHFAAEVARAGRLLALVHSYARSALRFAAQSSACNGLHSVPQRCAKWLLLTRDRAEADRFDLTHEYLAMMVGAHRPSVTLAAGDLQRAGVIRYRRGWVEVLDGGRLEAASCECYRATEAASARPTYPITSAFGGRYLVGGRIGGWHTRTALDREL
jgi:CRP-like cAMP-binding protein